MRKHSPDTQCFIDDLARVGRVCGFTVKPEFQISDETDTAFADLAWMVSQEADPVILIEVESEANLNMVQNAMKVFGSKIVNVRKPWFFFHVVHHGNSKTYAESLSMLKEYHQYKLYDDVAGSDENITKLLNDIHKAVLNILGDVSFEGVWKRFQEKGEEITSGFIREHLRGIIIRILKLPNEIHERIDKGELTAEHGKKLEEIKHIMHKSPEIHIYRMMSLFAEACIKEKWSVKELSKKLENLKFNYILNRFRLHEINREHDENMRLKGTCYCMDLRRRELKKFGHSDKKIDELFRMTERWGRQDHVHVSCCRDLKSDNFRIYWQVMNYYGIHHSDMDRLEPNHEELLWMIRQDNKWKTIDKGLCWNCRAKPFEVEMDGFLYCRDCAHAIVEERARYFEK